MKRVIAFFLCMGMLFGTGSLAEITVTDAAGRRVVLPEKAERIVSCYYISTSALLALGCQENLVGIEKKGETRLLYKLAAPDLLKLPAVGSGKEVNLETLLALNPDVVVLPLKLQDTAERLEEFGIPAVLVYPEDQEGLEDCIHLLGTITGREEDAENLLSRCEALREKLRSVQTDHEKVTVYMASENDPLITYPAGLYQDTLISQAGGENVAGVLTGTAKVTVDAEQLLLWNPEVIVIVSGAGYGAEAFTENEQFAALRAVQAGQVYVMPAGMESWDYPTPSSVLGAAFLCYCLHPERYTAQMLLEEAQSFYRDVYGVETDKQTLGLEELF